MSKPCLKADVSFSSTALSPKLITIDFAPPSTFFLPATMFSILTHLEVLEKGLAYIGVSLLCVLFLLFRALLYARRNLHESLENSTNNNIMN